MRRLVAAGLLPERAGQPVKVWAHISLADLLRLDGDSALQEKWTAQVRERWAAHRAAASATGSDGGAWLDGDAAGAIACDAAMAPVVTGDVNVDALEDLVRPCVELDGRRDGARDAAWAALEQAVIGKAVFLLLHSCSPLDLRRLHVPPPCVRLGTRPTQSSSRRWVMSQTTPVSAISSSL
jgi:hypothetical protein